MSRGPWVTPAFRAQVWQRWKAGESCAEIARALGKCNGPIYDLVSHRGGWRRQPALDRHGY
jgi:hypothetical protein